MSVAPAINRKWNVGHCSSDIQLSFRDQIESPFRLKLLKKPHTIAKQNIEICDSEITK